MSTHIPAALCQTFCAGEARRLTRKLDFHFTPKHGSWLNMAEIELSALARQCLSRRIARTETLKRHIQHWEERRNAAATTVQWQFTTADARINLRSLYPSLQT